MRSRDSAATVMSYTDESETVIRRKLRVKAFSAYYVMFAEMSRKIMSNIVKKTQENAPFLERYFSTHRELVTAQNIGRLSTGETVKVDKRFGVEIASGFSEALDGRVSTEYSFGIENGQLVADDGEPFEVMMLRARRDAYELSTKDQEMSFVSDRFELELDELYEQQSMARGEVAHNTMITFSPMTMEKADSPHLLKKGYQRPDLIRSMVRLSFWDGSHMHILTRSLDHSSLRLLKSSARTAMGYNFKADSSIEMLAERLRANMSLEEARKVLDDICASFDKDLGKETGKQSCQGAFAPENVDLLAFVESHPRILDNVRLEAEGFASECKTYKQFEERLNACLYKHLALYDEMLHGKYDLSSSISSSADGAAVRASENGTEYSLCGFIITSGLVPTLGSQSGFESLTSDAFIAQRIEIISKLMKEKCKGECLACGSGGLVYGCGLCARCNKVWCDEFRSSGNGIEIDTLSKRFTTDKKKNLEQKRLLLQAESVKREKIAKRFWN